MNNLILAPEPVQVLAVASGHAKTGKTTVAINLACALANRGQSVMLLDSVERCAAVAPALDLHPAQDLGAVLRGELPLEKVLLAGPSGITVVPAVTVEAGVDGLTAAQSAGVIASFSELEHPPAVLVVDTGAGVSARRFIQAAEEVLVLVVDAPGSLAQAADLIRSLCRGGALRFRIVANRVAGEDAGRRLFERLDRRCETLGAALHYVGAVPEDPVLQRASAQRQPLVNAFPTSPAARALKSLARRTETWAPPPHHQGGVAFFLERLLRSDHVLHRQTLANGI